MVELNELLLDLAPRLLGNFDAKARRIMYRTQIKGDRPV